MHLRQLLSGIPQQMLSQLTCSRDPEIRKLACDSRRVEESSLFFAIEGTRQDGHLYIGEALSRGAAAVASERERPEVHKECCWVQVRQIRRFMALCADTFFGQPSHRLDLVGVTGTNGKTTTAHIVHSIQDQEYLSVMAGTVQTIVGKTPSASLLTTPESIDIQETLNRAVEAGCRCGVLEVSSHALHLQRTYGCHFKIAVFTNLSQDHLDYHGSLLEYFQAKRLLFDIDFNPGLEHAVVNGDDAWGRRLTESNGKTSTFGLSNSNHVFPLTHETSLEGTRLTVSFFGRRLELQSPLLGRHNLYNLLAAAASCSLQGFSDSTIQEGILKLKTVPGRFEKVPLDALFTVVIDYAHTPDALENVLRLARDVTPGRLICLFGCGGDRDRTKRPQMGLIASSRADLVLVTSDNPRTEDPGRIIADIVAGIPREATNVEVIEDRREAIARGLRLARSGDLLLLAGKGHETYQDLKGRRIPFDERQVVEEAMCSL